MANNNGKKNISFEEFKEIPLDCIKIICDNYIQNYLGSNVYCVELLIHYPDISISKSYKSYRNFSEFRDLFELFIKNNPNEKFPEFPSRYTFLKSQEETKLKYFHNFLNRILELSKNNKDEIFNYIYNFIFGFNDVVINELTNEQIKQNFKIDLGDSFTDEEDKKSVKSEINNSSNKIKHERIIKTYSSDKLRTYNDDSFSDEEKDKDSNSKLNDKNKIRNIFLFY